MTRIKSMSTRRQGLANAGLWAIGVASLALGAPRLAQAGKVDKSDFQYQDRPKNGKRCADCRQYVAAAQGLGHCAIVDGEIAPEGWCLAFAPR